MIADAYRASLNRSEFIVLLAARSMIMAQNDGIAFLLTLTLPFVEWKKKNGNMEIIMLKWTDSEKVKYILSGIFKLWFSLINYIKSKYRTDHHHCKITAVDELPQALTFYNLYKF